MLEIIQTYAYKLLVYLQLYRENFRSVSVLESSVACICTRLWLEHVSFVDKNLDCRPQHVRHGAISFGDEWVGHIT